jgi:hypothetical protein
LVERKFVVGHGPILKRKSILGAGLFLEKDLFWRKTYFLKGRPNFGERATGGKKTTYRKIRKNSMQEESNMVRRKTNLTEIGLAFFLRIVTTISL